MIELLVVVAIITLLVSILLPSLAHARAMAVRTRCESNHRQVMLGFVQYANEHDDFIPPEVASDSTLPYPGNYPWYANRFVGQYIGNTALNSTDNNSYVCLCPALRQTPNWDRLGIGINGCWDNGLTGAKYPQIVAPSRMIMFIDVAADRSGYMSDFFEQFYQLDTGDPGGTTRSDPGSHRLVAYRHDKSTVVSFADGHVEIFSSNYTDDESNQYDQGLDKALQTHQVTYKLLGN